MTDSVLGDTSLPARDPDASAQFIADILAADVVVSGADRTVRIGSSTVVRFYRYHGPPPTSRCSILIDEDAFDAAYGRLLDHHARIWADPDRRRPAEIHHRAGGRGLWFADSDGHLIELATTPDATEHPE